MKLSPVQLVKSHLVRISVEPNQSDIFEENNSGNDDEAETEISLEHFAQISKFPNHPKDATHLTYLAVLGVRSSDEGNNFPYAFEVVITAEFTVDVKAFKSSEIDDSATRYSFTMLYGQIRETVTALTMRMRRGVLVLPTMSFMDDSFKDNEFTYVDTPE